MAPPVLLRPAPIRLALCRIRRTGPGAADPALLTTIIEYKFERQRIFCEQS